MKPQLQDKVGANGYLFLLATIFAICYKLYPLYNLNQHNYFLKGLANAGFGFLNNDWQAQVTDHNPMFTALVNFTYSYLHEYVFYLYYMALLGIYIYSILGIISICFKFSPLSFKYFTYFCFITALHSDAFGYVSQKIIGTKVFWGFDIGIDFVRGLALQYILGRALQPSMFGIFLILSIYLFLRQKPFLAVISSCFAAIMHASYLLGAATLTLTYMALIFKDERNIKKIFLLGILALALVFPSITYIYVNFGPTTPELFSRGQDILIDRMQHHADPKAWYHSASSIKIGLVIVSLYLVRHTKLFHLLTVPFIIASLLSFLQIVTDSKTLALIFPWRISIFLVPIASCVIFAYLFSIVFDKFNKPINQHKRILTTLLILSLLVLISRDLYRNWLTFRFLLIQYPDIPLIQFVNSTKKNNHLYLVPDNFARFRLFTGVPVVIDYRVHPYKDIEVIEWRKRVDDINDFYSHLNHESICEVLQKYHSKYKFTHVITNKWYRMNPGGNQIECDISKEIYRDKSYAIYEISQLQDKNR